MTFRQGVADEVQSFCWFALGVMAAACLALTWVVGIFTASMLTNLS
jgi:hypothetical protein